MVKFSSREFQSWVTYLLGVGSGFGVTFAVYLIAKVQPAQNPQSIGTLGEWVGGMGAMLAAFAALYIASDRASKDEARAHQLARNLALEIGPEVWRALSASRTVQRWFFKVGLDVPIPRYLIEGLYDRTQFLLVLRLQSRMHELPGSIGLTLLSNVKRYLEAVASRATEPEELERASTSVHCNLLVAQLAPVAAELWKLSQQGPTMDIHYFGMDFALPPDIEGDGPKRDGVGIVG